ncbi:MAG: hypothetical protein SGPRY_010938, partial [Prymnesium sp.]
DIRFGNAQTPAVRQLLAGTSRSLASTGDEEPIRLFCTNEQCDAINDERMRILLKDEQRPRQTFTAKDWVEVIV